MSTTSVLRTRRSCANCRTNLHPERATLPRRGLPADFSNAEAWDPGTESCTRQDDGPVTVGSTWHNVSKIAGLTTELTYRLAESSADHLVFIGENGTATSTDTITVRAAASGSEVTYHADIEMHGLAKLASPAIKVIFEKIGHDTVKQMTAVLNALPT